MAGLLYDHEGLNNPFFADGCSQLFKLIRGKRFARLSAVRLDILDRAGKVNLSLIIGGWQESRHASAQAGSFNHGSPHAE